MWGATRALSSAAFARRLCSLEKRASSSHSGCSRMARSLAKCASRRAFEAEKAVGGREGPDRRAHGRDRRAVEDLRDDAGLLEGHRAFEEAGLKVRPLSGRRAPVEGGADGLRQVEPGRDVDRQHVEAARDALRVSVDRHEAGIALHHRVGGRHVAVGAGVAEAGDGRVDDARVGGRDAVVVEPEAPGDARSVVLDYDVGARRKPQRRRLARRRLEVEGERALAAVEHDRLGREVADAPAEPAAPVAVADGLDLGDRGSVLREHHAAIGRRDALRELDDLQPVEGRARATLRRHRRPVLSRKARTASRCSSVA